VTARPDARDRTTLREGALLPIRQAMQLLPLSRGSLYRLAAEGALETVRVPCAGGRCRVLFLRDAIERYVQAARLGPPAPEPDTVDGILARVTGDDSAENRP